MRAFFAAALGVLVLLSVVAWRIQPQPPPGKVPLVWVSDDNPARREQIGLFNRLHHRYDLRLDPSAGLEKVILQCLAGVGPDLFDSFGPPQLDAFIRSGVAWDLTDELKRRGIDAKSEIWPAALPLGTRQGRIYGFPTNLSVDALWFHKDLFDQAGVPYPQGPWTWQGFLSLAKRMTVRDARGRITRFGLLYDWWQWPQFVSQWGGHIYSADGTRCVIDSPEAVGGIQFLHDLMYVHHVMPTPVDEAAMATQGGWGSGTITYFGAKKGAMAFGGRWWLCTLRDYHGLHLSVTEAPHGKRRVFRAYGRATLVNRYSPRREQALDFVTYEAGRDYNLLINRQADAMAAVIEDNYRPEFLHNPAHPEEDYNAVWREVAKYGEPEEISPFVDGQVAMRLLNKQLDLVKADQKPVAEALRDAARDVNKEIARTLQRDPTLLVQYRKLTGRDGP